MKKMIVKILCFASVAIITSNLAAAQERNDFSDATLNDR